MSSSENVVIMSSSENIKDSNRFLLQSQSPQSPQEQRERENERQPMQVLQQYLDIQMLKLDELPLGNREGQQVVEMPEESTSKQQQEQQFYKEGGDFLNISINRIRQRREEEERMLNLRPDSIMKKPRRRNPAKSDPTTNIRSTGQPGQINKRDTDIQNTGMITTKNVNMEQPSSVNNANLRPTEIRQTNPREDTNQLRVSLQIESPYSIQSSISNVSILTQNNSELNAEEQDTDDQTNTWACPRRPWDHQTLRSLIFGALMVAFQIFVILEQHLITPIANPSINLNSIFVSICISLLSVLGFGLLLGSSKNTSPQAFTQSWIAVAIAIELQPIISALCILNNFTSSPNTDLTKTVYFSLSPRDTEDNTSNSNSFVFAPSLSITNAMKCGIATIIALSGVLKHTQYSKFSFDLTLLEYFIVSVIGVVGAEISRITGQNFSVDVLGSSSLFGFGGAMGMTLAFILGIRVRSCRKAEYDLIKAEMVESIKLSGGVRMTNLSAFTSDRKNLSVLNNTDQLSHQNPIISLQRAKAFNPLLGCLITFVFLPVLAYDTSGIFLTLKGNTKFYALYPYYVCTACVTLAMGASLCSALSVSNLFHGEGKINVWDLVYAPLTGAICVGASSLYTFSPSQPLIIGLIGGSVITLLRCTIQKKYVVDRLAKEIKKDYLMRESLKKIKMFGIENQLMRVKLKQQEYLELFEPKMVVTPGMSWICFGCSLLSAIFSAVNYIIMEGEYKSMIGKSTTLNLLPIQQMTILFNSEKNLFLKWGTSIAIGSLCGVIAGVLILLTMYNSFSKTVKYWRDSRIQPNAVYVPERNLTGDYFDNLFFPE